MPDNSFSSPFQLLAGANFRVDSDVNANSVVTIPHGGIIFQVEWGYSAPPPAAATLVITDGGTTRFQIPITQDGPGSIRFEPALKANAATNDLVVTLLAGGANVTGYLNVTAVEGPPPPAFVQDDTASVAADVELIVTLGVNPVAGNSLIVCVALKLDLAIPHVTSIVAGNGQEFLFVLRKTTSLNDAIEIWYLHEVTGGAADRDITITLDNSAEISALAAEFSNLANEAPSAFNTNSGQSATPTTNPVTPSAAVSLILASVVQDQAAIVVDGPTNGFTALAAVGPRLDSAYYIAAASGVISTGWTYDDAARWAAGIVAFRGA